MISPWVNYCKELEALFSKDPEVVMTKYDEDANEFRIYVDNPRKADAITQLLPSEKEFGGVVLKITVIPSNQAADSPARLYKDAFDGNPAFINVVTVPNVFSNDLNYVVFKGEVVQYWDDDLGDLNGLRSTLYQDIARDVFGDTKNVLFCTEDLGGRQADD